MSTPSDDSDAHIRSLADAALADGEPTGWFERLYVDAEAGAATVPWADRDSNELLVGWTDARGLRGAGRRAVVVGCGDGRDAEHVAALGFDTLAFDVAPGAVRAARRRYPGSRVRYTVADLLDLPAEWRGAFDLVVESFTVQALPDPPRRAAIAAVGTLVAPGGTLLVIAAAPDPDDPWTPPPWPIARAEIDAFADADGGLAPVRVELIDGRWRAELVRRG